MRVRPYLLSVWATVGISAAASAQTNTIVLSVGPGGQYQAVSDAVSHADADTTPGNYYDIQIMPGAYTNDFPYVTRPLTIEVDPNYAGQPVVLKATKNLPNEKGIILTVASLTVNGLTFTGAKISNSLGGNGAGIRDQNTGPANVIIQNTTFTGNQEGILTGRPRRNDHGRQFKVHRQRQPQYRLFSTWPLREPGRQPDRKQ